MKKIWRNLLLFGLLLSLSLCCACSAGLEDGVGAKNSGNTTGKSLSLAAEDAPGKTGTEEKPRIYVDVCLCYPPVTGLHDYPPIREAGIYFEEKKRFTDENAVPEREITIDGKTVSLSYVRSDCCTEDTEQALTKSFLPYGNTDLYRSETGIKVEYFRGTDCVATIFLPEGDWTDSALPEEELIAKAEAFLREVVPEEELASYRCEGLSKVGGSPDAPSRYTYLLEYRRYIGEYKTADSLAVEIEGCGNIFGYVGSRYHMADLIEATVTDADIQAAVDLLDEELRKGAFENVEQCEHTLYAGTDGEIFVSAEVPYTEHSVEHGVMFYVRVVPGEGAAS